MWALIASALVMMHAAGNPHQQYIGAVESQQATYSDSAACDRAVETLNRRAYDLLLDGHPHKLPLYTCRRVA